VKQNEEAVLAALGQLGPILKHVPTLESRLSDLGLDSLAFIELVASLELSYGLMISDEEVQQFATVADIVQYLEERTRNEAAL
jgi:acyl carrier protein